MAICPNEEGQCAVIQPNTIYVPFYGAGFPYGCAGEETNDAMATAFGLPSNTDIFAENWQQENCSPDLK